MHAVEFRNVSKTYRRKRLSEVGLHDLSFSVVPGQVAALVGPNGAGKTTALKLVTTLIQSTHGSIELFGNDVRRHSGTVRTLLGYVAQQASVDGLGSVRENLMFQAAMQKLSVRTALQRIEGMLNDFQLRESEHTAARHLSGGQRRRLDIAMAIIHRPRILIMDEPSANLDPDSRIGMWRIIKRLTSNQDLTVLFSTHDLDEAERYADHIIFVDKGRTVSEGSPESMKARLGQQNMSLTFFDGSVAAAAATVLQAADAACRLVLAGRSLMIPGGSVAQIQTTLDRLSSRGIALTSVALSGPTLEDVYLELTGLSFDEEDIKGERALLKREAMPWQS